MNFNSVGYKKKKITFYYSKEFWTRPIHENRIDYFMDGFSDRYICEKVHYYTDYEKTDYIVIHGWKKVYHPGQYREYLIDTHNNLDTTIVLENCYLYANPDKRSNTSIGIGGFNGTGKYNNDNSPSDRFDMLGIEIKQYDWIKNDKILLVGQSLHDAHLYRVDFQKWISDIYSELRLYTDRPIYFRPHPKHLGNKNSIQLPEGCKVSDHTIKIYDELKSCYAVVSYNSNVGMECILAGIPIFSFNEFSSAYRLSYHDLSQIENLSNYNEQDRLQWLYNLAYSQWTLDEMKRGLPHKQLGLI